MLYYPIDQQFEGQFVKYKGPRTKEAWLKFHEDKIYNTFDKVEDFHAIPSNSEVV